MSDLSIVEDNGDTLILVSSVPTEDVVVRSSVGYRPDVMSNQFGRTSRVTKDVTLTKLINLIRRDYPNHEIVSMGTPVNFDFSPTHLTRVEMNFDTDEQVRGCLQEISVSDLLIRTRLQPFWDWQSPVLSGLSVILHVGWYDTAYFLQFKDIFLGDLHCRYSAKFRFDPRDAKITHYRYDDTGDIEEIVEYNEKERMVDAIKDKIHFIRKFRDGTTEPT